jgi:hypothetical protein
MIARHHLTPWAPITGGWLLMTGVTVTAGSYLATAAATLCTLMALLTAHTDRVRITHVTLLEDQNRLLAERNHAQGKQNYLLSLKLARFERSAENHHH